MTGLNGLEITFAIVGGVGFVFVLITFVLGEIFDFGGDLFDSEVEFDLDGDLSTPSMFSGRVISAALVGFGAAGFIASYNGAGAALAIVVAMGGFVLVGAGMFFGVALPLSRQQFSATISQQSYVGLEADVVLEVAAGKQGLVEFIDNNRTKVTKPATASSGQRFAVGSRVKIVQATASGVIVE